MVPSFFKILPLYLIVSSDRKGLDIVAVTDYHRDVFIMRRSIRSQGIIIAAKTSAWKSRTPPVSYCDTHMQIKKKEIQHHRCRAVAVVIQQRKCNSPGNSQSKE
jgi:hypothetical protein